MATTTNLSPALRRAPPEEFNQGRLENVVAAILPSAHRAPQLSDFPRPDCRPRSLRQALCRSGRTVTRCTPVADQEVEAQVWRATEVCVLPLQPGQQPANQLPTSLVHRPQKTDVTIEARLGHRVQILRQALEARRGRAIRATLGKAGWANILYSAVEHVVPHLASHIHSFLHDAAIVAPSAEELCQDQAQGQGLGGTEADVPALPRVAELHNNFLRYSPRLPALPALP
mmetsp:Transcript_117241/g.373464  ORF Transcript_117241/g.373464 Transcript_117241/m.373464 type:complete len:229 (-) Transcript_117241:722-1408(-)